jgi:hypothetical protein
LTTKVDDFLSIDLAWIRRKGGRHVGCSGRISWSRAGAESASIGYEIEHGGMRLRYRHAQCGGAPEDISEVIPIVTTPMHFGGCRHWFACLSCRRRCRIVYGGNVFRCRLCCGAKYESQYQHPALSISDRRWRIRKHLENRGGQVWPFGLDDGFPPKPKGMHWRTYRRLEQLDDDLAGRWRCGVAGYLELLDRKTFDGKASPLRR